MRSDLTYDDFANLMHRYEKNCTQAQIDRAWAQWCTKQSSRSSTR